MGAILVTGASGFIGSRLVAALCGTGPTDGDGRSVRALVRSDAGAERVRSVVADGGGDAAAIEIVRGSVLDANSLSDAARGASVVYHLAGGYRGLAADLREVHVEGSANLLGALARGTRLVHVSSTSVYGWDQAWPADETSPPRPSSAYGRAKLAAERLVTRWADGDVVVARPTITYGPGDTGGMLARAVGLMQRGMRWFPGDGDNRIHLLHVDDLVGALMAMGRGGQGTYVLGGPEAASVRRILQLAAAGASVRSPRFGLPAGVLAPLGTLAETMWSAAGSDSVPLLTRHGVEVLTRDRAYACTRAKRDLGWWPEIDIADGVPATARWLAEQASTGADGTRDGRRRGERPVVPGLKSTSGSDEIGFDWRGYVDDPDEGLGTVYERFALDDVLAAAIERTGSTSILHAPAFGMMGWPGLDAVLAARRGVRVGLLDFDAERLDAVVGQWRKLGLDPEVHLVDGPEPSSWPRELSARYDLVFSFAALWWFDDIDGALAAQARWADRAVLCCVPNRNVFMRMRAGLWHRDLFRHLNPEALDTDHLVAAAAAAGLAQVHTGLFDIPPFPDTSVPLAKLLRSFTSRRRAPAAETSQEGTWSWSILPYLAGDDPDMPERIARLARWERYLPAPVAPALAHHRYLLFVPSAEAGADASGAAPVGAAIHSQ